MEELLVLRRLNTAREFMRGFDVEGTIKKHLDRQNGVVHVQLLLP